MSNIYLQVPYYVDCFYRCRATEEKNWVKVGEPLEFSKFSEEYYILHHYLSLDEHLEQGHKSFCFSQHDWKTMLTGKSPVTGEKILVRDKEDFLSVRETYTLLGVRSGAIVDNSSYLCIKIPAEVFSNGNIHHTNASYTLSPTGVKKLRLLVAQEFQHAITIYIKSMEHYVERQGGTPQRIDLINAFLSRYGIFKVADHKDRESLRRMLNRWLGNERYIMEAERLAGDMVPYLDKKDNAESKSITEMDEHNAREVINAKRRKRYREDLKLQKKQREWTKRYKNKMKKK